MSNFAANIVEETVQSRGSLQAASGFSGGNGIVTSSFITQIGQVLFPKTAKI